MRKGVLYLSDQCRLLSLLLILLASVVSTNKVHGSPHPANFNLDKFKTDSKVSTEYDPRVVRYHVFHSLCSKRHVQIRNRGKGGINARASVENTLAVLQVESSGLDGKIRILGEQSQLYLCFNRRGRLIAKHKGSSEQCVFKEKITPDGYTTLQSVANEGWYVGFRKNGKPLKGYSWSRAVAKEKCIRFMKGVPRQRLQPLYPQTEPKYGPEGVDFSKLTLEFFRKQNNGNS